MMRSFLVALLFASVAATALVPSFTAQAQIQMRTIPADAKRATMTHIAGMTVDLNGNRVLLASGAQIRDDRNMIIVPTALPPGSLVKVQLDAQGQIWRIWILSPQEAAQPDPKK